MERSVQQKSVLSPMSNGVPVQSQPLTKARPLQDSIMRKIESKNNTLLLFGISFLVVLAGVGTGWLLSGANAKTRSSSAIDTSVQQKQAVKQSDTEAGIDDATAFPDTAEGTLVKGGIDGEGQYHLERIGGVSQNVYLTSTVIDLASFESKKVQVWGQSLSGKKAGWLMDVGKVKVIE